MSGTLAINCLVLGESEEEIFTVEIKTRQNISALNKEIKKVWGVLFREFDASKFTLCTGFKQFDEIKDCRALPEPNLKA